jgi:hypothetical protein
MLFARYIAVVICAASLSAARAGPTPVLVRSEIDGLLARLESSGCEFGRNGTWYDGARAKAHLLRKLDYIEHRQTVASTEEFIALAATSSSMSGKPYEVRCGHDAPVASAQWLAGNLADLRAESSEPDDNAGAKN